MAFLQCRERGGILSYTDFLQCKEGEGGVADGAWSRAIFESVLVSVGGLEKVRRPFFGLSVLKKSSHT